MKTRTKQILLVEDDRFLRRACAAGLRQCGWTVLTAEDGEEALRMTRYEAIDLVLLDMLMPKLHGLEVMRALRADERTRAIPVISPVEFLPRKRCARGSGIGGRRLLGESQPIATRARRPCGTAIGGLRQ